MPPSSTPQHSPTSLSTDPQQQTLLQTLLKKYNLQSIQQLSQILFDRQLSILFKQRFVQLSPNNHYHNNQSPSTSQTITQRLQKMALQHSYNEMFIYYQQFPQLLQQCKNVLKFKYHFDDILRTHNNRKSIWLLCSGALEKIKENPQYYSSIEKMRSQQQQLYPEYFQNTIEKDVVRTIGQSQIQQRQALSRILRNFAIRNPYIGYCQGMNFIVAFLLQMQFTQQQIFWLIVEMFQNHLPKSYYTNMLGVGVDICIMEYYIKMYYPSLSEKLQQMGLSLSLFTLEWLVCLFTSTLPFYMLVIVWDMLLIYGQSILIKVCLIILDQLEETILHTTDLSQLLIKIQEKKKGIFIDENKFIARIMSIYVDEELLGVCRELVEVKLNMDKSVNNSGGNNNNKNSNKNNNNKKNLQVNCNIQWPICHKTLKSYKLDLGQIQTWTFKQDNPPKLIKDYLQQRNKLSYKYKEEDNRSVYKKLLIGRIPHTCDVTRYNRKQSVGKQSIQLEQINLLQKRKVIYDKLQSITEKLGIENQHVKFFRRAAHEKLDLLQFSILNNTKNAVRSSFSHFTNQQTNNNNNKDYSISASYGSTQGQKTNTETSNNNEDVIKQEKNQTQSTITDQNNNNKKTTTRNPFKKLKFKWNQRKNKQKTIQQS